MSLKSNGARPSSETPAALGGAPVFPEGLPLARPHVGDADVIADDVRKIVRSGVLTNGSYVRELERRASEYLEARHCIAVSSCTAGLMLVLRCAGLSGDVVVPSFTFAATAHAVAWNGLRPAFADVDPDSLTLSAGAVQRVMGFRTSAIMATHTFGTPCDIDGLADVAARHGVRLFFDAAHAFGSRYGGKPIGSFGHAEVFSLSPTKPLTSGEGGIIATDDDVLAERCRIGRDYGNPGNYDCLFVGLNARMSEMHAAVALASIDGLEARIARRNALADRYRDALAVCPGLRLPKVREGDLSTYKDFTILVDRHRFGITAAELAAALAAEGIETRRYYAPPVHSMQAYRGLAVANGHLPVTDNAVTRVLTLPLFNGMSDEDVDGVAAAIRRIREAYASGPPTRSAV